MKVYCIKNYENAFIKSENYECIQEKHGVTVFSTPKVATYFSCSERHNVIRQFKNHFITLKELREYKFNQIIK